VAPKSLSIFRTDVVDVPSRLVTWTLHLRDGRKCMQLQV